MTTLESHATLAPGQTDGRDHVLGSLLHRLDRLQARRWTVRLLTAVLAVSAIALGAVLAVSAGAGYWHDQPPVWLRWLLLAGMCAATGAALLLFLGRALLWRQNVAQTARFVEQAMPGLRNDLINSVLLADDRQQASPELVDQAIREGVERSRAVDIGRSISMRGLKRWALAAALSAGALAGFAFGQPGPFQRGLLAVLSPTSYVPANNRLKLVSIEPPDNAVFYAGQAISIIARIENPSAEALAGQVFIRGEASGRTMLVADNHSKFTSTLGGMEETFQYYIRIGDSRWPTDKEYFSVNVIKAVNIESLQLACQYPAYIGKFEPPVLPAGEIHAPIGTVVTVTACLSASVPVVQLETMGNSPVRMEPSNGNRSFSARIYVDGDGDYRLSMLNSGGNVFQHYPAQPSGPVAASAGRPGYFRIKALADDLPVIDFVSPARDVHAAPGSKVAMQVKAVDRYGLGSLKLLAGLENKPAQAMADFPPVKINGRSDMNFTYQFDLSPYKKGDVVVYHASALDNRNLQPANGGGLAPSAPAGTRELKHFGPPQSGVTRAFRIVIADAAEVAREKARRYEELRRRLLDLLKIQESQRVNCEIMIRAHDGHVAKADQKAAGQIDALRADLAKAQRAIRSEMLDIVEHFPFDEDTGKLQGELAVLANNEAAMAAEQSRVLAGLKMEDALGEQGALLAGTQDKIIDSLQRMLAIMPSLTAGKSPSDRAASRPTELTPEVKDKLTQLKSDLEQFTDAQKKIIEASDRLTKKPVDQFTAEDEKALQDLKAQQDKWEKFLSDAFSDFSKLAQQDFSNPALMKELISVKSDITMAKDALSKKATEIATALEENGIENAKSLTANIEKWLPDKPDREKWNMEDPVDGQMNVEQAELPKELEDLVGDLLEEEEDLFEEMQDLTSKYTMSGDKGIGWDAADGPIANMNAQGVTGNQLPNSNEMGGRSGEGRTGKSSGEFVEDKSVGKGGRRTPTRLTAEPFQKGEVKDDSSEPPGGATGGGKVSGSGGEGLEGPVPPPLAKEMKRMAGKQANLLNRAERLSANFSGNQAANVKLLEAITLMARVQKDLTAFRYQNVLRTRKDVLSSLGQSRLLLSGNIEVSTDVSGSLPKYIMDDISDAKAGKMPEEFEDAIKEYYRRLTQAK